MKRDLTFLKLTIFAALIAMPAKGNSLPYKLNFLGTFSMINFSSPDCEKIFDLESYELTHYRTGSNGLTSVLAFKGSKESSFTAHNLVGLLGYQNDFLDEKVYRKNGLRYHVKAEGIIDSSFVLAQVKVSVSDPVKATLVCTAEAQLYGN